MARRHVSLLLPIANDALCSGKSGRKDAFFWSRHA
jgi:hypothetical protein